MVERDRRAPVASIFTDAALSTGAVVVLDDSAAHHVRVKRLESGDAVRLIDGAGCIASGAIAGLDRRIAEVVVEHVESVAPLAPIHVRVPVADRDRMLWLAEKATELGITTWQAVRFRRSASVSPRGEGVAFAEKVRARMVSALEQSGGAWLPRILPDTAVEGLFIDAGEAGILLDATGAPLGGVVSSSTEAPVVLFGPEGGIETDETNALVAAGWTKASVASTTLRFETAGIAAIAVCRNAYLVRETDHGR